jgi:hypothetical protein
MTRKEQISNGFTEMMKGFWGNQDLKVPDFEEPCKQEPCEDCISRDMALEKMADYVASGYAVSAEDFEEYSRIICQLPPITPQPKTGYWITKIKSDLRGDMWPTNPKCSKCGGEPYYSNTIYNYNFCPYCGAKMVEPQESEE